MVVFKQLENHMCFLQKTGSLPDHKVIDATVDAH